MIVTIDQVIKDVSKNLNVDPEIVQIVCKHPFNETVNIMKDDTDIHDILFNGLFTFRLKKRFKENKTKPYSK